MMGCIAVGSYRGWLLTTPDGEVVAGAGVQVRASIPRLEVLAGPEALVVDVFVEPYHRRRGLTRRLMVAILAWCRSAGIGRIVRHPTDTARLLYALLGFAASGEVIAYLWRWTVNRPPSTVHRPQTHRQTDVAHARPRLRPLLGGGRFHRRISNAAPARAGGGVLEPGGRGAAADGDPAGARRGPGRGEHRVGPGGGPLRHGRFAVLLPGAGDRGLRRWCRSSSAWRAASGRASRRPSAWWPRSAGS